MIAASWISRRCLVVITLACSSFCGVWTASAATEPGQAIGLHEYVRVAGPLVLEGVDDDLSGLTFAPERGTLLAILNSPATMLEVSRNGVVLGTTRLRGFDDTEDLAWIGSNRVAVVEERRGNICIVPWHGDGSDVTRDMATVVAVAAPNPGNKGLEGIAAWPDKGIYLLVKEKLPRALLQVAWEAGAPQGVPAGEARPWLAQRPEGPDAIDFSAITRHVPSGHLLILSDESRVLIELTPEGEEIARLSLTAGSAGLAADVAQPEGVAFDGEGRLYLCSEPNLLYIFERKVTPVR